MPGLGKQPLAAQALEQVLDLGLTSAELLLKGHGLYCICDKVSAWPLTSKGISQEFPVTRCCEPVVKAQSLQPLCSGISAKYFVVSDLDSLS